MAAKVVFSGIKGTMLCMRCLLVFALLTFALPLYAAVNPDGSFSETLPIEIPAGRNGLQPQLALTYNSNAGNGIVGVGFSLQGLPAITRTSYGRGINYDGQDTYVGPEGRLVPLPASPTSGGGVYHAENETWSKYEPLGNDGQALTVSNRCGPSTGSGQVEPPVVSPVEPCQWRVTDRSGVVYLYGANSQSRALAIDAAENPKHSGAVRQWALTRVTDLNGNYYEVEYYQNAGQIYPKRIRYTYGPGASKYYTITFAYDESSRPDKEISYASSSFVQTNWRLREVLVEAEQPIWWIFSWTVQVRRYDLGYETNHSNTSSELASWSVTAGNQVSTTQLRWLQESQGFETSSQFSPPWVQHYWGVSNGVQGDYVDFDGDGLVDFLLSFRDLPGNNYQVAYRNTGHGWVQDARYTPQWIQHFWGVTTGRYGHYVDITGDGLLDYVVSSRDLAGNVSKIAYINTRNGWQLKAEYTPLWVHAYWGVENGVQGDYLDFDGDGLTDYVVSFRDLAGQNYTAAYRNNGHGWVLDSRFSPGWIQNYWGRTTTINSPGGPWLQITGTINGRFGDYVDVNADGLPDFIASSRDLAGNVSRLAYINTGSGWLETAEFTPPWIRHYWGVTNGTTGDYLDVNGDGLPDYVASFRDLANNHSQTTWLNTGRGWRENTAFRASWTHYYWAWECATWCHQSTAAWGGGNSGEYIDINGDGRMDYVLSFSDLPGNNTVAAWINTNAGWTSSSDYVTSWIHNYWGVSAPYGDFVDFNGDYVPDYMISSRDLPGNIAIAAVANRKKIGKSLLQEILSPTGTKTIIQYKTATKLPKAICPTACTGPQGEALGTSAGIPNSSPRYLVTEVTTTSDRDLTGDGVVDSFTTRYEYYNGRVATGTVAERASLGFEKVKTIDVNSGNYSIATYRQDKPFHTSPSVSRSYLANGTLLSEQIAASLQQYLCDETGCTLDATNNPNPSLPRQVREIGEKEQRQYINGILALVTKAEIVSYDKFGNPTETRTTKQLGSDSIVEHGYATYINQTGDASHARGIGFLATGKKCVADCSAFNTSEDKEIFYDNQPAGGSGLKLLQTSVKTRTGSLVLTKNLTYYPNGNLHTEANDTAALRTFTYDSDYSQFLKETRLTVPGKADQVTTQTADPRFGGITESYDLNGTKTARILDDQGRVIEEKISSAGGTLLRRVSFEYHLTGNANPTDHYTMRCTHRKASAIDTAFSDRDCSYTYVDALNRKYLTIEPGVNGTQAAFVATHTKYDDKGRATHTSAPYFKDTTSAIGSPADYAETVYDTYGRVWKQIDAEGNVTETKVIYSGGNTITTQTIAADGKITESSTDLRGLTKSMVQAKGTGLESTVTYTYHMNGLLWQVNAPQGLTVIDYYTDTKQQKSITDPNAGKTEYTYENNIASLAFGKRLTETRPAPNGSGTVTVSYEYNDAYSRLTKQTYSTGDEILFTYDEGDVNFGKNRATTTEYRSRGYSYKQRHSFDEFGQELSTTTDISHQTEQLCAEANTLPCHSVVRQEFDEQGRKTKIIYPDLKETAIAYVGGSPHMASIAHNGITYATYDGYDVRSKVTGVHYGNGARTEFGYAAPTGLLENLKTYDVQNRKIQDLDYTFTNTRNIEAIDDNVVTAASYGYEYDELNRVKKATRADGKIFNYAFDAKGNLTLKENRIQYFYANSTKLEYSDLATAAGTIRTGFIWSASGNLLQRTAPGEAINYTWSAQNFLIESTRVGGALNGTKTTNVYAGESNRFLRIYEQPGKQKVKTYDSGGVEIRETWSGATRDNVQVTKYVYGVDGSRIASITGNLGELVASATSQYQFTMAKFYNGQSVAGITAKTTHLFMGCYYFGREVYAEHRITILISALIFVLLLLALLSRERGESFGIKDFARRLAAFAMMTTFVAVNCTSGKHDPAFSNPAYYAQVPNLYTGLPSGTVYYHANHLGSSTLMTDETGVEKIRVHYTTYGEIDQNLSGRWDFATGTLIHDSSQASDAYLSVAYTGQQYSIEEEMYYYGARHYDPTMGVFISADTIIDFGAGNLGFNRYMYVAGNPVRFSDPTGHNIFEDIGNWVSKAWEDTKKWVSDNAKAIKTIASVIFNPMAAINAGVAMWAGVNAYVHAKTGNWLTADQGWDAFGAGAQAGAISAAAAGVGGIWGIGASATFGTGFWGTVAAGAVSGAMGGLTGGALNGWNNGRSFKDGILDGLTGAAWGAVIGGVSAGIGYGIEDWLNGGSKTPPPSTSEIDDAASAVDDLQAAKMRQPGESWYDKDGKHWINGKGEYCTEKCSPTAVSSLKPSGCVTQVVCVPLDPNSVRVLNPGPFSKYPPNGPSQTPYTGSGSRNVQDDNKDHSNNILTQMYVPNG